MPQLSEDKPDTCLLLMTSNEDKKPGTNLLERQMPAMTPPVLMTSSLQQLAFERVFSAGQGLPKDLLAAEKYGTADSRQQGPTNSLSTRGCSCKAVVSNSKVALVAVP